MQTCKFICRFLEEICASKSEVCQEFVHENRKSIQKVITKSLSAVQKTSKAVSTIFKIYPTRNKAIRFSLYVLIFLLLYYFCSFRPEFVV